MHAVHTSMAMASSHVRRTRSVSTPIGKAPSTPTMAMAKGSQPTALSETWKTCLMPWMPSTAWDSDWRSPDSSAVVIASATSGAQP